MALTATMNPTLSEVGQKCRVIRGTLVFSGNYPTGGDILNLTLFAGAAVKRQAPVAVRIWGKGTSNHFYGYVPGADLTDGKVIVTLVTTGAELVAGAYPAGVTGDVITFEVVFPKLI
ncbi:MAG: hypothetical protein HY814_14235 [Candidatus Riflebacteria bacterium]|nr:hypothetical protein [Candidatus Riflebacteria bacterium]